MLNLKIPERSFEVAVVYRHVVTLLLSRLYDAHTASPLSKPQPRQIRPVHRVEPSGLGLRLASAEFSGTARKLQVF